TGDSEQARLSAKALIDGFPGRLLVITADMGSPAALVRITHAEDEGLARAAVEAVEQMADQNPELISLRAAALHARGLLTEDPDLLRTAVELYRGSRRRLDRARAIEDCAEAEFRAGERQRALELYDEAIAVYQT